MSNKSTEVLEAIISFSKDKKEFRGINDKLVSEVISLILRRNNIPQEKLEILSKQDIKFIVKEVRSELRLSHGRFYSSSKDRDKMLEEGKIENLLMTHTSTKERAKIYPELKELVKKLKVKSALDLGCGLNPLAMASMFSEYHATDINEEDLLLVKKYFSEIKIKGDSFFLDLTKCNFSILPQSDVCFVLKVLDIIGANKYEITTALLKETHCKYFIISFSTKKLSGKPMNHPRRIWFERILNNLSLKYKALETSNELFYIIDNLSK